MKSINNWDDLREFGINALTGEADRTGQRILCDLNDEGRRIVYDLLGIPLYVKGESNWNRGSDSSMMLPYSLFKELAVWCLLVGKCKCAEVYVVTGHEGEGFRATNEIAGLFDCTREEWEEHIAFYKSVGILVKRIRVRAEHPGEGTRCTHQFTGRTS